ncbi:hypothetical protein pb186bvf_013361 [Paramecium bursaria]
MDSEEQEYNCECGAHFRKKSKLQRHYNETHLNLKQFVCEICNKAFKRSQHLKRHQLSHTQERPYKCEILNCPQSFNCKHHLKRHIKLIHEQKPIFECQQCKFTSMKKRILNKHIKDNHSRKEQPNPIIFVCKICGRQFYRVNFFLIPLVKEFKETPFIQALKPGESVMPSLSKNIHSQIIFKQTFIKLMRKSRVSSTGSKISIQRTQILLNSRLYDNHYDPKLHSAPFLPSKSSETKYYYSDIGLGQIKSQERKLKKFKDFQDINQSVSQIIKNYGDLRPFPELKNLQTQIVITIEYCTNCQQHQNTTRHVEQQYYDLAVLLKQKIFANYPEIKVYLKPLIFEYNNEAENIYLQRRIGAFEVQLKYGSQVALLHSKLKSKKWPDLDTIISQIPYFCKKTNVLIQLKFEDQDSSLRNIEVTLTQQIQKIRSTSQNSSYQLDRIERPSSSTQSKSINRVKRVSSAQENYPKQYVQQSDHTGRVLFQNLPIDKYQIVIPESYNNQLVNQQINIADFVNQDGAYLEIELKKPLLAQIKCEITYFFESQTIPCTDSTVYLHQRQNKIYLKEIEGKSGIYESMAEIGSYMLVVFKYQYETHKQQIDLKGGINNFKIELTKLKNYDVSQVFSVSNIKDQDESICNTSGRRKIKTFKPPGSAGFKIQALLDVGTIKMVDLLTQEAISSVQVKIQDQQSNKIFTQMTNEQGTCKIYSSCLTNGSITMQHRLYYTKQDDYGAKKDIDMRFMKQKTFNLIRRTQEIEILVKSERYPNLLYFNGQINQLKSQQMGMYTHYNKLPNDDEILTYLIPMFENQEVFVQILMPYDHIIDLQKSTQLLTQFPVYWVLGYRINKNDNIQEFEVLNELITSEQLYKLPNYQVNYEKQNISINPNLFYLEDDSHIENIQQIKSNSISFNQKIQYKLQQINYLNDNTIVYQEILESDSIFIIYENLQYQIGVHIKSFQINDFINVFEIDTGQVLFKTQQEPIKSPLKIETVQRVYKSHDLLFIIFQNNPWVGILDYLTYQPIGCCNLNSQYVKKFDADKILAAGEFITIYTILKLPDRINLKQLRKVKTRAQTNEIKIFQNIFQLRVDGVLSIFSLELENIQNIKISDYLCRFCSTTSNDLQVFDQDNVYLIQEQDQKYKDDIFIIGDDSIKVYTKTQIQNQTSFIDFQEYDITEYTENSFFIFGDYVKFIQPLIKYYDQETEQEFKAKKFIQIPIKSDKPFDLLVEFKGLKNISPPTFRLFYFTQEKFIQLDTFTITTKKNSGLMHLIQGYFQGIELKFIKKYNIIESYEQQPLYIEQLYPIQTACLIGFDDFAYSQNQDVKIMTHQLNIAQTIKSKGQIRFIKSFDDTLIVGSQDGWFQVYKQENPQQFYLFYSVKLTEKPLIDCTILDGSYIISHEDRKLVFINQNTFSVELQEPVERSFAIFLGIQGKYLIIGQEDGRLKVNRKERSGNFCNLSLLKTITTIRQSFVFQLPWDQNLFMVGGLDKGVIEAYSIETQKMVKQYNFIDILQELNNHKWMQGWEISLLGLQYFISYSSFQIHYTYQYNTKIKLHDCSKQQYQYFMIILILIQVVLSDSVLGTQKCTCAQIKSLTDCNTMGCDWVTDTGLCQVRVLQKYCTTLNSTICPTTVGCAYDNSLCQIFTGCSAYNLNTDAQCKQLSTKCTSDGTRCIATTTCNLYTAKISCVTDSSGVDCYWGDNACSNIDSCVKIPTTVTTDADCRKRISSCTVAESGKGCAASGASCVDQKTQGQCVTNLSGTQKCIWSDSCKDLLCTNIPLSVTTTADCLKNLANCTVADSGQGCISYRDQCSSYKIQEQCKYSTANQCQWSNNACSDYTCATAGSLYINDSTCSTYLSTCTVDFSQKGCITKLTDCTKYTLKDQCRTLLNGTQCTWVNGGCVQTLCVNAILQSYSEKNCATFSAQCTVNTALTACVIRTCAQASLQTVCASISGCVWINEACRLNKCENAPTTYKTDQLCKSFLSTCATNGAGCYTKGLCTDAKTQEACTTDITGQVCAWNSSCAVLDCTQSSKQTFTQCQAVAKKCTTNGVNCIPITACTTYKTEVSCVLGTDGPFVIAITHAACQKVSALCTTDGSKCVALTQCSITQIVSCYYGTDGQCVINLVNGVKTCQKYTACSQLNYSTHSECYAAYNLCTSNGTNCMDLADCSTYTTITNCFLNNKGSTCTWDTSTTKCRDQICADIQKVTDSDCSKTQTGCTTNQSTCITKTTCALYPSTSSCFQGTDGTCTYDNTANKCKLKVCTDITDNTLCTTLTGCVAADTGCVAQAACSSYTTQTICNNGGTDGVCVWSSTASTCSKMTSCDQANLSAVACKKFPTTCKWTPKPSNGGSSSCTALTFASYQSLTSVCQPLPALDGLSFTQNCLTSSAYTYYWDDTASACTQCQVNKQTPQFRFIRLYQVPF